MACSGYRLARWTSWPATPRCTWTWLGTRLPRPQRRTVYAMLDECSHEQGELSGGEVEDGGVECWLHGSRFDLTTGVPTGPPATRPAPVYPVRITGTGIHVALPTADVLRPAR